MKKVLTLLIFSGLLFNSTAFSQKSKSVNTSPAVQSDFVVFDRAEAFSDGAGVWLRWQTASETNNLGFRVYRAAANTRELVSEEMLPGGYLSGEEHAFGRNYTFFDPKGSTGTVYYLESLGTGGRRQFSNPIFPQVVGDLKRVAGASSETLARISASPKAEIIHTNLAMPKALASMISANRLPSDIAMQRWVAAQQGVKIGVRKEGIFRVPFANLPAGFDTSSPDLLQLYRNGVEQSIIVVGGVGGYIEFYGQGIDTLESDTQSYYLIDGSQNGQTGKRIGTSVLRPFAGNVEARSFPVSHVQKQRLTYTSDILNGDAENFFDNRVVTTGGATIPFTINSIDFNVNKVTFRVAVQGLTFGQHSYRVLLNGEELGLITGTDKVLMTKSFQISSAVFTEGANSLRLISTTTGVAFLESFTLDYSRLYKAQNNHLSFFTNPYRASNLSGFSSPNIRVFNVDYPDTPVAVNNLAVTQNGSDFSVRLPANRNHLLFAVEDSAVAAASSVVPNVPSTLTTAPHNASLVIITYKDWLAEANNWATYRRSATGGNFTVEVVTIDDIYDEFSYGAQSTLAIRNFLQHARNQWGTQYALLLGDASYDFRKYDVNSANTYVPTRLVDTVYMETGSDEALADFNDDGLAEMAIGRIATKTPEDVTQALNRVAAFELTVPNWLNRGALFAVDQPEGYDFLALSERLREHLPANMPVMYVMRNNPTPLEARTQVLAALNAGKYLVNYSGHGSTAFWGFQSNPPFFNSADALALTNGDNLSIFSMLTCLNGYFISPTDSLAENLMKAPNGGAIVAWTSTGKTTPDVQEVMATRFYDQLTAGNIPRMGDLVKDAKTVLIGGRDVRLSWVLFGDPTLKVR